MSGHTNGRNRVSTSLRFAGASAAAAIAYGVYRYYTSLMDEKAEDLSTDKITSGITESQEKRDMKPKYPSNVSISLVITPKQLKKMEILNHNDNDTSSFVDFQEYLRVYPKLIIILYPGLRVWDLEEYFEFNENFRFRVLETGVEESVFHVLKQINSEINLISFDEFSLKKENIDKHFKLENILPNVIDMGDSVFSNFI